MSERTVIRVPAGPPQEPFLSAAIQAGDFVFVSGSIGVMPQQRPDDADGADWIPGQLVTGGIRAETTRALENIRATLDAAGASLRDVVKVNAFLFDIDRDFDEYNDVYMQYFPVDPPARMTVQAKIYGEILVEIECLAYRPRG